MGQTNIARYDSTGDLSSHPITLGWTPANGRKVIAIVNTGTAVTSISGVTAYTYIDAVVGNSLLYEYIVTAGASENGTVTIALSSTGPCSAVFIERDDVTAVDVFTHSDQGGASSAAPSTGTTAATTQASEVAYAAYAAGASRVFGPYSNGFSELSAPYGQASGTGSAFADFKMAVASKALAATGTVECTATLDAAYSPALGIVVTFKTTGAGTVVGAGLAGQNDGIKALVNGGFVASSAGLLVPKRKIFLPPALMAARANKFSRSEVRL